MDAQVQSRMTTGTNDLPFEVVALVLQGGGALGAYQASAYEALSEAGIHPNWMAGMSIGAINAAIIAGNPPNSRVERLREFWMRVTAHGPWFGAACMGLACGDVMRHLLNQMSAGFAMASGASGLFAAQPILRWLHPAGTINATSLYDTRVLKSTRERLVDFDRLNTGEVRFSVGAVNVTTGNFVYFDTRSHTIGPEHVMASGALPPGLPAIEIEDEHYWDGPRLQYTAAMGRGRQAASRDAGVPGRSLERTWRVSA